MEAGENGESKTTSILTLCAGAKALVYFAEFAARLNSLRKNSTQAAL
jgi:hypothetical protein